MDKNCKKSPIVRMLLLTALLNFSALFAFGQLQAHFTANDTDGCAGRLVVTFASQSTGTITGFSWDFGDGSTSTNPPPVSHTYANPGQYTVSLTVTNGLTSSTETRPTYITVFANPIANFTFTPDNVCSGTPITFTNASIPGSGADSVCGWSFNDGSGPALSCSTIVHSFTNMTGSIMEFYPNLLVLDKNGCNSTFSDTVHILPKPVASFSYTGVTGCTTPATAQFINNSQYTTTFYWTFGDPFSGASNTSSAAQPSHVYNNTGTYQVILTAGTTGCLDRDTHYVALSNPLAAFIASDTVICVGDTVNFNSSGSSGSYAWNFGDPASGLDNVAFTGSPSHTYNTPGNYTVTLTVGVNGCSNSVTKNIIVHPNPVVYITPPIQYSCKIPFTVQFRDSSTGGIASWLWYIEDPSGGPNTYSVSNPVHTYNIFDSLDVSLEVTDTNGCSSSALFHNYVILRAPVVGFTQADSGCAGSIFPFTPLVISPIDTTITNYQWNFGDNTPVVNSSTANITHQFDSVGFFDVTLTITTSTGCTATHTDRQFIRIGEHPTAAFSIGDDTICFQQTIQFTDLSPTPPTITWWSWNFGDGSGSCVQNPNHEYNIDTSGTIDPFDVTLIVYNYGCADTLTKTDSVVVLGPMPDFSPTFNCITPLSVYFQNLSGGATNYAWNFGDGSPVDTNRNTTHVFPNRGTYRVTLYATNSETGCVTVKDMDVRVTVPDAQILAVPPSGCFPLSDTLNGQLFSVDVNTYSWNFGDPASGPNNTSTLPIPIHNYIVPGIYQVILEVTDIHFCTDRDTVDIHVNGPTADFHADVLTGCSPLTVNFFSDSQPAGGNLNYWYWDFGDGSNAASNSTDSVQHTFLYPGQYSIFLSVRDVNGCESQKMVNTMIIATRPQPITQVSSDTVCRNQPIDFSIWPGSNVAAPCSFQWDFGDGSMPAFGQPVTHSYPVNGNYTTTVITTDQNGCTDTTRISVLSYTTPAHFTLQAIDTCVNTASGVKQAQVFVGIVSDSNAFVTNWNWNLGVTTLPNGPQSVYYTYAVPPDTYAVSLVVTNQWGCSDTVNDPGAVVVPGPSGSFSFDPHFGCRPLPVEFYGNGLSPRNLYTWDFGDGTVVLDSRLDTIRHTYTNDGYFIPSFYIGFQLAQSTTVCYVPVDTAGAVVVTTQMTSTATPNKFWLSESELTDFIIDINDPSNRGPYTYTWDNSAVALQQQYTIDSLRYEVGAVTSPTTYCLYVTNSFGCADTTCIKVYPDTVPCFDHYRVPVDTLPNGTILYSISDYDSLANVITPNGDDKNNFLEWKMNCDVTNFHIVIYNRWGRIVYESNNADYVSYPNEFYKKRLRMWDGKDNSGTPVNDGVYYFIVTTDRRSWHDWVQVVN